MFRFDERSCWQVSTMQCVLQLSHPLLVPRFAEETKMFKSALAPLLACFQTTTGQKYKVPLASHCGNASHCSCLFVVSVLVPRSFSGRLFARLASVYIRQCEILLRAVRTDHSISVSIFEVATFLFAFLYKTERPSLSICRLSLRAAMTCGKTSS